tara:strand:- start:133 stop:1056 length:924 start_codon:yes stop_codon:yes gene_type:complete
MRILYIDKIKKTCNYYKDIVVALKLDHDVLVVNDNKDLVNKINKFKADIIIIGFGVSSGEKKGFLKINLEVDIPTYVILNKEYTQLKEKLDWIKSIKPPVKKVFSVHHDVLKYQEYCNIPFTRIMWSADDKIFKQYDNNYTADLFFSGVIREEQTDNIREKIYNKLKELEKYKLMIKVSHFKNKKLSNKLYTLSNEEYARAINDSKIALSTTGPVDIVGTRYFEIMAVNKALIMCNRMPEEIYEDIVIDKMNCVMFDDENDFIEKCKYYLEHEEERKEIVNNAYKYFLERHMWKHKITHLIDNLGGT